MRVNTFEQKHTKGSTKCISGVVVRREQHGLYLASLRVELMFYKRYFITYTCT